LYYEPAHDGKFSDISPTPAAISGPSKGVRDETD
jgi:hypothetical protein